MRKINRRNCISFYTIYKNQPCETCGAESDVFIEARSFFGGRIVLLCHSCRRKWLKGEINL